MLAIVQIWDAQNQEVTRRVGATSRRIVSKIAKVLHDGKTTTIVPKAGHKKAKVIPDEYGFSINPNLASAYRDILGRIRCDQPRDVAVELDAEGRRSHDSFWLRLAKRTTLDR
jgi:hypothetical protein